MLILAHRPFPAPQPYAELGPIFLCADACAPGGGSDIPEILASPDYIIRGYSAENRIVYGIVSTFVNIVRSVPFVILIVTIMPLTRAIMGTTIGSTAQAG